MASGSYYKHRMETKLLKQFDNQNSLEYGLVRAMDRNMLL